MKNRHEITSFPPEVAEELRHYVYRLVDPRNGETFYIGKGQGDRVFEHARGAIRERDLGETDEMDPKLQRIHAINRARGPNVIHIIHRHGMTRDTAHHVEAALIDATPGLTNLVGGHHSGEFGPRNAAQIMEHYAAEEASIDHKALLLNVGLSISEHWRRPVDAARYAWRVSRERAEMAEVILAVDKGMIRGVFVAREWLPATAENFPGFPEVEEGKWGFVGGEAPAELAALYLDKRVPESLRFHQNPVRYVNC